MYIIRVMKNSKVPILSKKGYLMYRRWRKPVLEKGYVESQIPEDYSFFPLIQTIDYKKFEMYLYQYTKGSWVQFKDQILPNMEYICLKILQLVWHTVPWTFFKKYTLYYVLCIHDLFHII